MTEQRRNKIQEYREAIKALPKVPFESPWEFYEKDAMARFKIAEGFLLSSPELIADDCCGRGLPSYAYSAASKLYGFKMNNSLEIKILKINYLRVNALDMVEI